MRARSPAVVAQEGDEIRVGGPLAVIRSEEPRRRLPRTQEPIARPRLEKPRGQQRPSTAKIHNNGRPHTIAIAAVRGVTGGRVVRHHELLQYHPSRTVDEIERLTGIESRRWLAAGEDAVTLAVTATRRALDAAAITPADLDLVVCTTATPTQMTPSMACQIMAKVGGGARAAAFDVSAACSGYLYALRLAHDFLQSRPSGRVLIVTAEAMSTRTDVRDFETAFLFGDAATATVLVSDTNGLLVHRPILIKARAG